MSLTKNIVDEISHRVFNSSSFPIDPVVPMKLEALPCWMAIPIDWKRKNLERHSPLILLILFLRSSRNYTVCGSNGHRVSAPIGMK